MGRLNYWKGKEDSLFAIALGTAIGLAPLLPVPGLWKLALSGAIFMALVWIMANYPWLIARLVVSVSRVRPALVNLTAAILLAGTLSVIVISARSGGVLHSANAIGRLIPPLATAALVSALIGVVDFWRRYGGSFPRQVWFVWIVRTFVDAAVGAGAMAAVWALARRGILVDSIYGWMSVGALAALLLRTRVLIAKSADQPVALGPAVLREAIDEVILRAADRHGALSRMRFHALVVGELRHVSLQDLIAGATLVLTQPGIANREEAASRLEAIAGDPAMSDDVRRLLIVAEILNSAGPEAVEQLLDLVHGDGNRSRIRDADPRTPLDSP